MGGNNQDREAPPGSRLGTCKRTLHIRARKAATLAQHASQSAGGPAHSMQNSARGTSHLMLPSHRANACVLTLELLQLGLDVPPGSSGRDEGLSGASCARELPRPSREGTTRGFGVALRVRPDPFLLGLEPEDSTRVRRLALQPPTRPSRALRPQETSDGAPRCFGGDKPSRRGPRDCGMSASCGRRLGPRRVSSGSSAYPSDRSRTSNKL